MDGLGRTLGNHADVWFLEGVSRVKIHFLDRGRGWWWDLG